MGQDRGGSRESKGASLKKTKNNPGGSVAKAKTAPKAPNSGPAFSLTPPQPGNELYFDTGVALLSRQFDRDRDRVVARAKQDGNCCGMLLWFSDIEKQNVLADFCKTNSGMCYFSTGIHPDNIDRTNKKSHEDWLEKVEELAKKSECIGILSGLNLSREIGTHFAQESLLKSSCALAEKLKLPLILHINDYTSLERCIELLKGENWVSDAGDNENENINNSDKIVILHDAMTCCEGNMEYFQIAINCGFHFILTATGIVSDSSSDDEVRNKAQECIRLIPTDKVLIASNAPWSTPQNIPDVYLRTLRNEPSNICSIFIAISETFAQDLSDFSSLVKANTLRVFGLEFIALSSEKLSGEGENGDEICDSVKGLQISGTIETSSNKVEKSVTKVEKSGVTSSQTTATTTTAYYSCNRCRGRLFGVNDIKTHSLEGATKTVFKVGDEGLCASFIFLKTDPAELRGIAVKASNIECVECSNKLGKYTLNETNCGCGAVVGGPVMKVNATKVDYSSGEVPKGGSDIQELALRARQETEELRKQDILRAEEEAEREKANPKRDKKKKNPLSRGENKGNYSMFRNKSFIPNASRKKGSGGNSLEHLEVGSDEDEDEEA